MRSILAVDDETDLRELIVDCFDAQYEVTAVGSLAEARAELKKRKFEVVLLDVSLPDGSGLDFGIQLLADPGLDLSVLFMTGHADVQSQIASLPKDRALCMIKPYSFKDLISQVDGIFQKRQKAG